MLRDARNTRTTWKKKKNRRRTGRFRILALEPRIAPTHVGGGGGGKGPCYDGGRGGSPHCPSL
jgi:hypothetical protein